MDDVNGGPSALDRRGVIKRIAGLPLATVLANPALAQVAARGLRPVSIATDGDGRTVGGALAVPSVVPAAAVVTIHEWWGLNDQIKAVTAALGRAGYLALAVDLYDGRTATTPEAARALSRGVDAAAGRDTLGSWIRWLRAQELCTGRVATMGWCFGGGWSLNAALVEPVEATVVYYGNVARGAAELAALRGPVLGHFATRDRFIDRDMVAGFEAAMDQAGKALDVFWYEADHAFANPTGARYDAVDAALAWRRTLDFLKEALS